MTKIIIPSDCIKEHNRMFCASVCRLLARLCRKESGGITWGATAPEQIQERNDALFDVAQNASAQDFLKKLYEFHRKHDILTTRWDNLEQMIKTATGSALWKPANKKHLESVRLVLGRVFDYGAFRDGSVLRLEDQPDGSVKFAWSAQGKNAVWSGRRLTKKLGVRYCPYCNAETVGVASLGDDGGPPKLIQSALDHFVSQSDFPFLGLSLWNLIPSCSRCNSNLKGAANQSFDSMLYPYRDNVAKKIQFAFDPLSSSGFYGRLRTPCRHLTVRNNEEKDVRTQEFLNTFKTEGVYQWFYAKELIQDFREAYQYGGFLKEGLEKKYPGIDNRILNRIVFKSSCDSRLINLERLGKARMDMSQQVRRLLGDGL